MRRCILDCLLIFIFTEKNLEGSKEGCMPIKYAWCSQEEGKMKKKVGSNNCQYKYRKINEKVNLGVPHLRDSLLALSIIQFV